MDKLYVLVVVTCLDGVTETETTLFNDLVTAKISFGENYRYQMKKAPEAAAYDGYFGDNKYWFEIGETSDKYWSRGEIQTISING